MNNFIKVIVIAIVAIVSFFLKGCTSTPSTEYVDNVTPVVLPDETRLPTQMDYNQYIINDNGNQYRCLNMVDFNKYVFNGQEVLRYTKQLNEENKTLRSIIERMSVKGDSNGDIKKGIQ